MPLSDYNLIELVARTNMSEVWRATDQRSGIQVALKRRPPTLRAERRFIREIRAQKTAAGPHTMPIVEHDASFSWYAMPWADGTLADRVVPAPELVLEVLEAITSSLQPIHALGQVHRDLKPENLLRLNGHWVVADFGIVRNPVGETTTTLTQHGGTLGSSGWMAPEQHGMAHDATPRTDVYSAGAVVSWLMTGRRPVPTEVYLPEPPSNMRLPVWKASRPRALDRYADMAAFLTSIRNASVAPAVDLRSLVKSAQFAEILAFAVNHPSQYAALVETLPLLSKSDVRSWYKADGPGAHMTVHSALEGLRREGIGDLPFRDVDSFLSWTLYLLEEELKYGKIHQSEETAVSVFAAIAEIHQFAPARDVLDWLDTLSQSEQIAMETALKMSDAWGFFESQASGRFATSRTTPLVRRLSGD